jgi:hypothetical protein
MKVCETVTNNRRNELNVALAAYLISSAMKLEGEEDEEKQKHEHLCEYIIVIIMRSVVQLNGWLRYEKI